MNREEATTIVDALFASWYPSLLRYALRMTGHPAMAEDAVQETFMHLYRGLAQGSRVDNPKAWTLSVLRRELGRQVRDYRRDVPASVDELESLAACRVEPEYDAMLYDDVVQLFSRLSPREEEVLLLRMEAMKYSEIGAHLGISANSVTTLLSRALRKLKGAVHGVDANAAVKHHRKDRYAKTSFQ